MKTYPLKITSAVVIDGTIQKAGAIVEVREADAKRLLERGKAVVATADDLPAPAPEAAAEAEAKAAAEAAPAEAPAPEPEAKPAKAAKK